MLNEQLVLRSATFQVEANRTYSLPGRFGKGFKTTIKATNNCRRKKSRSIVEP